MRCVTTYAAMGPYETPRIASQAGRRGFESLRPLCRIASLCCYSTSSQSALKTPFLLVSIADGDLPLDAHSTLRTPPYLIACQVVPAPLAMSRREAEATTVSMSILKGPQPTQTPHHCSKRQGHTSEATQGVALRCLRGLRSRTSRHDTSRYAPCQYQRVHNRQAANHGEAAPYRHVLPSKSPYHGSTRRIGHETSQLSAFWFGRTLETQPAEAIRRWSVRDCQFLYLFSTRTNGVAIRSTAQGFGE